MRQPGRAARMAALAALAVVGAACSNKVVNLASIPPPATTTTTLAGSTGVTVNTIPPVTDPAFGDPNNSPIEVLRKHLLAAITTRLTALNQATQALNALTHLGASGLALERDEIATATQGLDALQAQVQGEHDLPTMRHYVA